MHTKIDDECFVAYFPRVYTPALLPFTDQMHVFALYCLPAPFSPFSSPCLLAARYLRLASLLLPYAHTAVAAHVPHLLRRGTAGLVFSLQVQRQVGIAACVHEGARMFVCVLQCLPAPASIVANSRVLECVHVP